jgi:predicted phosphodiesterase
MRLAVFSDIHGNLTAFDAMLADLKAVGEVDMVWFLGDLCAFGGQPAACIERLHEVEAAHGEDKFRAIGGNTDRYLVTGERMKRPTIEDTDGFEKERKIRPTFDAMLNWALDKLSWEDYEYLKKILHREVSCHAEGYGYAIGYHAIPGDDEAMSLRPDSSEDEARDALLDREGWLAIGGHTHLQMDRDLGGWRAVNVGSVGLSFDMPGKAQWGLFTFENGGVHVDLRAVPFDVDAAITAMQQNGHPHPKWGERMRPR